MATRKELARKTEFVDAVTRGEGFVPWQRREPVSTEELAFRDRIERRKTRMLDGRSRVNHPTLISEEVLARIRKNVGSSDWAERWYEGQRELSAHVVGLGQPDLESLIPELTPGTTYPFYCPACLGTKSQPGESHRLVAWDHRSPDVVACRRCGQVYPDPAYPETGQLVCPRSGQKFTCYLNDDERRHPEDRSGRHAHVWARHPVHVSFSGSIRERKIRFVLQAVRTLALVHALEGDPACARATADMLYRLARCFRGWLYHDYWDTVADCDPLYAAWHDRNLPIEWKRHLCCSAYRRDDLDRAAMQQTYWGAGRPFPTTGSIGALAGVCLAYDLTRQARDGNGRPIWTSQMRATVERDLILEWLIEAEPFVGGRGKARNVSNMAPRIYHAQAAAAKCLGLPELADTALRGYEAIRDASFGFDGCSRESPGYTHMYLGGLLPIPDTLQGFRWPTGIPNRKGTVDLYRTDPFLSLALRALVDLRLPDGRPPPMSDTIETPIALPQGSAVLEAALNRYPEELADDVRAIYRHRGSRPTEYALMHADLSQLDLDAHPGCDLDLSDVYFPAWMTAILRHGKGRQSSALYLPFSPDGGHRHPDNLSLYYFDRGRTILGDQGYLSQNPIQQWIKHTFSHNLVIVDDLPQRFREAKPRRPSLRWMVSSPRASVVEAASDVYDSCRDYRRLVALIKGPNAQTFAVDIFRVKGGFKHDYRLFSELAASDSTDGSLTFHGLDLPGEPPLPEVGASMKPEDIFGLRDVRTDSDPPAHWQAIWKEKGRRYRLWMLSPCHEVQASNGPGQETWEQQGRRVRFVDAIRKGKDLASSFVAVHEPSGPRGTMPVKAVVRLDVPRSAGPNAIAVRIDSRWGTYHIFSEFSRQATVEGIRFRGTFGILYTSETGKRWLLTSGARTLSVDGFGFSDGPSSWSGKVVAHTATAVTADTPRPARWPRLPEDVTSHVRVDAGGYTTGFPVRTTGRNRITVDRFPLPRATRFHLPAVRYETLSGSDSQLGSDQ